MKRKDIRAEKETVTIHSNMSMNEHHFHNICKLKKNREYWIFGQIKTNHMQRMQNLISNKRDTISQTNHISSPGWQQASVINDITAPLI
jgi:hypothetical protein